VSTFAQILGKALPTQSIWNGSNNSREISGGRQKDAKQVTQITGRIIFVLKSIRHKKLTAAKTQELAKKLLLSHPKISHVE